LASSQLDHRNEIFAGSVYAPAKLEPAELAAPPQAAQRAQRDLTAGKKLASAELDGLI
jgi:hypothetical protein